MRLFCALALALAIGLAAAVSPFASASPDGLEKVADDEAFLGAAEASRGPIAGYALPGVDDPRLATGLAGVIGTLVVFGLGAATVRVVRR